VNELFCGERVAAMELVGFVEVRHSRPEARNALDARMRDELVTVLDAVAARRGPVAVGLLGEGPDFCAGGDLDEFGTRPDVVTAAHVRLVRSLPQLFAQLGARMVVGLHGAVVGAGIELAAFARCVLAAADARIRLPEVGMGLIPGAGGTVSIPRRIARHHAVELVLLGEWADAATARRWGLVDDVVAGPQLTPQVRARAREMLR
jgi:enoyl-CoA hydratase/carnithine racemase